MIGPEVNGGRQPNPNRVTCVTDRSRHACADFVGPDVGRERGYLSRREVFERVLLGVGK